MNAFNEKLLIGYIAMSIIMAAVCTAQDGQAKTPVIGAQPKLRERDQGERRLRRKTGSSRQQSTEDRKS
jgi:hypothetical protein